jgi:CAAX prenyl protease-like protein
LFELASVRPSFNPFQQIPDETLQLVFLLLRFCLLALLVPIIEELFLRGWLIRYIEDPTWWAVSLVSLSLRSVAWATIYGVLAHPGEALAAFVWFSLVSWLMLRTGNLWDCVVAHGITNLLLGIYIVAFGAWHLW